MQTLFDAPKNPQRVFKGENNQEETRRVINSNMIRFDGRDDFPETTKYLNRLLVEIDRFELTPMRLEEITGSALRRLYALRDCTPAYQQVKVTREIRVIRELSNRLA